MGGCRAVFRDAISFFFSPALILQTLLMGLTLAIWGLRGGSRGRLRAFWGASFLTAYALAFVIGVIDPRGFRELRRDYPLESLEPRLAGRKPEPAPKPISLETKRNLDSIDREIRRRGGGSYRNYQLKQLHAEHVHLFVVGSGFGVGRMLAPSRLGLQSGSLREPIPLQPESTMGAAWPASETTPSSEDDFTRMNNLLTESIVDFANPGGFGYFQDRRHVAGFEAHRFSRVPFPGPGLDESWKLERLELVSLLLHEVPAVYVSDRLPAMNEPRKQPTRHLDPFETLGLYALREGRELYVEQTQSEIRMLGAVRATQQCLACHEAQEADLLGAFSYRLRTSGP